MCSAQDDLLKWGAVVALGRRDAEDACPYRFGGGFDVLVVRAIQESPCLTQCHQKPSLVREGGPLAVDE